MPFGQSSCNSFYQEWLAQVGRLGDLAGYITIEHAVPEPGEQLRG